MPQTATLIVCHHSDNARVLKEMEGSGSRYFPAVGETSNRVEIIPATMELLQKELAELGLIIEDLPTIEKVAKKFRHELISRPGGSLAADGDTNSGLYEVIIANYRLLDAKLENFGPTSRLLKQTKISKEDIGKIFYSDPEKKIGFIISNEDFLKMNPDDVGGWIRISELDVNP